MFRIRERIEYRQTKNSPSIEDESAKQIDILKFISSTHRTEFHKRRDTEWRVIFAVLTVYVTATFTELTDDFTLDTDQCYLKVILCLAFILLALFTSIYLCHIHQANAINKNIAERAENALMRLTEEKGFKPYKDDREISECWNWSLIWEVITLSFFSIISSVIITL